MKKIEYAVGAAAVFVQHMHQEGFDRGMVATFGDSFRVDQGFTPYSSHLYNSLSRIARSSKDGSTRLYDSIEDVINEFWRTGARDRPWLLTIITDGQDNSSRRYGSRPDRIGSYILQRFNHEPSNFPFLIGVGEGNQIDKKALGSIGDCGRFPAVTIAAFHLLEMIFLQIAVNVSSQLVGRQINVGRLSWQEVAEIRSVSRVPIDYAFLIDRSASMDENG